MPVCAQLVGGEADQRRWRDFRAQRVGVALDIVAKLKLKQQLAEAEAHERANGSAVGGCS